MILFCLSEINGVRHPNCLNISFLSARIGGVTILRKGGSDFISNGETGNYAYSDTLESK